MMQTNTTVMAHIETVKELTEHLVKILPLLDPTITVTALEGKNAFVCGEKYPSFEIAAHSSKTGRTVYVHASCQKDKGNACERAHRYFSLRQDFFGVGNPKSEYSFILIATQGDIADKYIYQLQRAATISGANRTLGFVYAKTQIEIGQYAYHLAKYLNPQSVPFMVSSDLE